MNILIIKTGALGDVVRTSFIAQALKDKYKQNNPKIYWITDKKALHLFINNPYVDEVIASESKDKLRSIQWDLVINLEEDEENCRFTSSLNTEKILGVFLNKNQAIDYTSESSYWFDTSMVSKLGEEKADKLKIDNKKTHRQIMAEIIRVDEWKKYQPFLRLTNEQRKIAQDFMRRHNLSRKELIIGINTGAADRWPKALSVKKTAEIINTVYKKYKAKILLFGGPTEYERNQEILRISKAPVITTGCGNDLVEFPALISACNIFITSDSLGLHIALALKRKTICLIGPTSSAEVDMYGFGEKVVAKSKYVCTYRLAPKNIMDKLDIKEIYSAVDNFLKQKVTLLITGFKEPKIGTAIEAALNQKTKYDYDILVSVPDKETLDIVKSYAKKYDRVKIFNDPGRGKSYALNLIFESLKTDILILTDGDVYLSDNSVEDVVNTFWDPEIGCLTGQPTPVENRKTKYGFWANFLFEAAHLWRKNAFESNKFLECSGYLFAFRKNFISKIPLDVAEDSVIPYFFWEKGYKIGYVESARVFVKNVNNWKDWISQKTRTSKAHETLAKYVNTKLTPRAKTFKNEASGLGLLFSYPKTLREYIWTFELGLARLYMWLKVFFQIKIKKNTKVDNWERVESAR
jgi:heptosyltransferase-2